MRLRRQVGRLGAASLIVNVRFVTVRVPPSIFFLTISVRGALANVGLDVEVGVVEVDVTEVEPVGVIVVAAGAVEIDGA